MKTFMTVLAVFTMSVGIANAQTLSYKPNFSDCINAAKAHGNIISSEDARTSYISEEGVKSEVVISEEGPYLWTFNFDNSSCVAVLVEDIDG